MRVILSVTANGNSVKSAFMGNKQMQIVINYTEIYGDVHGQDVVVCLSSKYGLIQLRFNYVDITNKSC